MMINKFIVGLGIIFFSIPVMAKPVTKFTNQLIVSSVTIFSFYEKPINSTKYEYLSKYMVKKGDNLSSISRKFYGVSSKSLIEKIAEDNHIKNINMIYTKETLLIPLNGNGPFFS